MNYTNSVKINLNLPALERLLGGDSELEIQLRNQVLNQFAGKYLKSLIHDKIFQSSLVEVRKEVGEIVTSTIAQLKENELNKEDSFKYRFERHIETEVKKQFDEHIATFINGQVNRLQQLALKKVEQEINYFIEAKVKQALKESVAKVIESLPNTNIKT